MEKIRNDVTFIQPEELLKAIPEANYQIPDREILTYYQFAQNRIFFVDYEIDDYMMLLVKEIIRINKEDDGKPIEDRKPIVVGILSYGGQLDVTFSFIDICAVSKTPVYTVNMGIAMSAGLLLLLAGHKRFGLKHSTAMIHSGSAGFEGTFEQVQASQKHYQEQVKQMREYILDRTKIDPKKFSRKKAEDWYITSTEQIELGIIDEVITDIDEVF